MAVAEVLEERLFFLAMLLFLRPVKHMGKVKISMKIMVFGQQVERMEKILARVMVLN